MRPTPTETIRQLCDIIERHVEPEITSEYALSRLREIRRALLQIDWEDGARRLSLDNADVADLIAHCVSWTDASPTRQEFFADQRPGMDSLVRAVQTQPEVLPFAFYNERSRELAHKVVGFIRQLAAFAHKHPDDQGAAPLQRELLEHYAGRTNAAAQS